MSVPLEILLKAKGNLDAAVKELNKVTKGAKGMEKGVKKSSKGIVEGFKTIRLAALGIVAAVIAAGVAFFKFINVGREFEKQIARVAAITGGATEELEKLARVAGKTTVFTATEAAKALEILALAGLNVEKSAKVLVPALNLATAAGVDIDVAVDSLVGTLKTFQIDVKKSANVVDILTKVTQKSNTNFEQMSFALSFAGSTAAVAGASLEDTTAIIGALADIGIKGGRAGVQLRQAFARLIKPTSEAGRVLESYGITQEEVNDLLPTPIKLFERLSEVNLSQADALEILGVRQTGIFKVIKDGVPNLIKLREEIAKAGGAAQFAAETQLDTFDGALRLLGSAFQELVLTLTKGGGFLESLKGITQALTGVVLRIGDFLKTKEGVIGLAVAFGSIGLVLKLIVASFRIQFKVLQILVETLVTTTIANVKAIGFALIFQFDKAKETIAEALTKIKDDAVENVEDIVDIFGGAKEGVVQLFNDIKNASAESNEERKSNSADLLTDLLAAENDLGDKIKDINKGVTQDFIDNLKERLSELQGFSGAADKIGKSIFDLAKIRLDLDVKNEKITAEERKRILTDLARANKVVQTANALINTAVAVTAVIANPALAIAVGIAGALQAAVIAATDIPAFKHGGKLRSGETALVGEAGPELFTPQTPGVIIPNDVLRQTGNDNRVSTITTDRSQVNISVQASDPIEFINGLKREYGIDIV